MTVRIAMWSGPRNISTAMMRAWEARGDCYVSDEPLYAHYLAQTQIPHPGFDEILMSQSLDWRVVVDNLRGHAPDGSPIWYQKHMTHHLLDHIDRAWMADVRHCFLIRNPAEVISSYSKTRESVTLQDIGFAEQANIYRYVRETLGQPAPVIDSRDVLMNPHDVLRTLCETLDVAFTDKMLSWSPGPRETDGVWAKYWYHNVEQSNGFRPYQPRKTGYPSTLEPLKRQAQALYDMLYRNRITP